ncbi:TrlF family AAA-like ATPase [Agrococcus beijingensis]|uniref:TrlF family AAA-like ATPase n=1 Tax=Agrococcus beijingensis TaxID=3068634 RepID=UPI002740A4A9|nr:hypothetical protein [Agrococcus sp. REN33]
MSVGAHWVRAALQVNPYSYEGRNAPKNHFDNEEHYNAKLLDECEALGITLIAITDHWRVESAAGLIDAAETRGIVALPGFEANSSEGIHILVLFEAKTPFTTINAAIGRCGVTPGCANGTVGDSYALIMDRMTADGALPIPAHANVSPAGMLATRSGQPLATMIKHAGLHAIGITPSVDNTKDQQSIVEGTGLFERVHPLAVIHADDVMGPRQLRTAGASSWYKVSAPSLESLKLAVRTPQTRVSLNDPVAKPRPRIKSVSWVGGYLDGVSVPVSSDLTALIGGRGAGKSTVIESIRYALDIEPISTQMKKDHKSIVGQVLNAGTIVRIEVESVSPTVQSFTIEREVPHPPVVFDASRARTKQTPADAIGQVEVFGQHELAELASDSGSIAELVRRFDGSDGENPGLAALRVALRDSRADLKRAEEAKSKLESDLELADRLEEQVSHYEQTDVPAKLAGKQRLTEDEAVFKEGSTRLATAHASHESYLRSAAVTDLAAPLDNVEGVPQAERLQRVSVALTTLHSTLADLGAQAAAAFQAAKAEIEAAKTGWQEATVEEQASYGQVLRELTEKGLDPGKFVSTKAELTNLKASKPRLTAQKNEIKDLKKQRDNLLGELRKHETNATEHLHTAVRSANAATDGVVVVRPVPAPDRTHILDLIKSHTSGQRTQITTAVLSPDFSPRVLAEAIRGGIDELDKLDIKGAQAVNLVAAGEDLARELEELSVGLAVEVLLKVDGATALRTMDQLSKGQRATALLLLLLGASEAPLIIDQPEDDLDNNFVYKGVVKHLRSLKGKRQVIASTHNANVPVLGDAELIVVLESDGTHGKPADGGIGSLDDRTIRSLAENILEGGPAAFNARHHLYGF